MEADVSTGSGSPHKEKCCICHTSEKLSPCHTCSLVFHPECIPAGWVRNSLNQLFCSICVDRKWDRSPPLLTPPVSPRAQLAQLNGLGHTFAGAEKNPLISASRPDHEVVSSIDQSSAHHLSGPGSAGENPVIASGGIAPNSNRARNASSPEPKRRQRKSRYSTLAADVDLALATIYREVESIPLLRSQIEDLRSKNAQQSQTITIYEQNLIALRREIERLKTHATNSESASKELDELRERNSSLEAELQLSMQQSAAAKELKERLAQLLSN